MKRVVGIDDGPLAKGSILGTEVTFLIDTGAIVTIVSPAVLSRTPELRCPTLKEVKTDMLLADGSFLPFLGCTPF